MENNCNYMAIYNMSYELCGIISNNLTQNLHIKPNTIPILYHPVDTLPI